MQYRRQIVGDEEITDAKLPLQILQQIHDLGPDGDIQGRYRFVQNDQLGVERQGPGNGNALPLSAAKFMREQIDGALD